MPIQQRLNVRTYPMIYLDKALLKARGVAIITISSTILLVNQHMIIARHFLAIEDIQKEFN